MVEKEYLTERIKYLSDLLTERIKYLSDLLKLSCVFLIALGSGTIGLFLGELSPIRMLLAAARDRAYNCICCRLLADRSSQSGN
jgi:hypothetical protein